MQPQVHALDPDVDDELVYGTGPWWQEVARRTPRPPHLRRPVDTTERLEQLADHQ